MPTPDTPSPHPFTDCSDDEHRDGARLGCPRCQAVQRILSARGSEVEAERARETPPQRIPRELRATARPRANRSEPRCEDCGAELEIVDDEVICPPCEGICGCQLGDMPGYVPDCTDPRGERWEPCRTCMGEVVR